MDLSPLHGESAMILKALNWGPMRFRVHRITTVQRVNPTVPFCGPLASGAVFYTFFGVVGRAHSIATPLTLMGAHPMPSKKVSRKRKSAKGHRRPSKARP